MEINSIPPFNTENNKERAKKYGAPAVMSAGAVMLATRAPKDTENPIKFSKRLSMSAKAGLATAAVVGLLSLNKEKVDEGLEKAKNYINEKLGKPPKNEQNTLNMPPLDENVKEVSNKEIENTEEKEADKAIAEAKNLAEPENPVPNVIEPNVQQETNFFMNNTKFPLPPSK